MIDSEGGAFGFDCYLASPEFRVFQQPARTSVAKSYCGKDCEGYRHHRRIPRLNLHAEVATPKARWKNPPPLAEFRRKLSRRYSLFDVGMACIRVWMELYEVCMSSIEEADRRAEGERRAAPDGTRKKAGRSSGRQKKAG